MVFRRLQRFNKCTGVLLDKWLAQRAGVSDDEVTRRITTHPSSLDCLVTN